MDPGRQLIRWSIPGAILLLTLVADELVAGVVFVPKTVGVRFLSDIDPAAAVFVIALGIPIGFVMYQVYYYVWDGITPWLRFLPVPLDRGKQILLNLRPDQLDEIRRQTTIDFDLGDDLVETTYRRLTRRGPRIGSWVFRPLDNTVHGRKAYRNTRRENWRAVRWIMMHGMDEKIGETVRAAYASRSDTYHALGGARYGVLTGSIVFFLYNVAVHWSAVARNPIHAALVAAIVFSGTFALILVLRRARANTLRVIQSLLMDSLRTAFETAQTRTTRSRAFEGSGTVARMN